MPESPRNITAIFMLKHKNIMLAIIKVVYKKVTITNPYGEQGLKKNMVFLTSLTSSPIIVSLGNFRANEEHMLT